MMRLRNSEKIILHLYEYRKYEGRYEYPFEITQQGIAEEIGISVTHVPRSIKKLIDKGLVTKIKGHVPGKKKKISVYLLTPLGVVEAKNIVDELNKSEIKIGEEYFKFCDIKKKLNIGYLSLIEKIEKNNLNEEMLTSSNRIIFKEVNIKINFFVDRKKELESMKLWYLDGKVLSIVGARGYGKTYLIQKFTESLNTNSHILWFHITYGRKWKTIKNVFITLFGTGEVLTVIKNYPTLLIFDGYYEVDDEFVSALNSLVKEDIGKSKIIVSMRTDTPYYNRFYSLSDVAEGRVTEIKLNGIPYENAREMLPDVKDSALRRIMQMTMGNPQILAALRTGNVDDTDIQMTGEQVKLIKYLAEQKR